MSLGRFVSHQSRAVLLVIGLLSVAGIVALFRIPRALFPQTDFPRIIVSASNGVAPTQQTLVSVTRPIEEAMSGIPGIARIKSITARGGSEVDLFFDWRTDIRQTLQLVRSSESPPTSRSKKPPPSPSPASPPCRPSATEPACGRGSGSSSTAQAAASEPSPYRSRSPTAPR